MGVKFNERFENHMDGVNTGTNGDAKQFDDAEEDAYDDGFDERLSDFVEEHIGYGPLIDDERDDLKMLDVDDCEPHTKRIDKNGIIDTKGDQFDVESSKRGEIPKAIEPSETKWGDDDQQLWDNDFGAVNKNVINYDDPDYLRDGIIKPNWGRESVNAPEQIVLPKGTRIVQYAHPDQTGVYFAPEGTAYEDLQLPDSKDKRIGKLYEVQEGGLSVDSSEIAIQPWNKNDDAAKGTGVQQFVTKKTADKLIEEGKLKSL